MNPIALQALLALGMFGTTLFAGLGPIKLLHFINNGDGRGTSSWILSLLSCFAGGVFMGTCFLDIFPHVNVNYDRFRSKLGWKADFPFPEFFICCGFFLVYFLEEASLRIFARHHHHQHSNQTHNHPGDDGERPPPATQPLNRPPATPITPLSPALGNARNMPQHHRKESRHSVANDETDSGGTETYLAVKTHEIVIDESLRYMTDATEEGGILKSLTFAIAMSFHSILEGFALGVQDNTSGIITLFVSLIIHKGIEAFSVGLQISKSNPKRLRQVILTITTYAMMTPLGSMLGVLIQNCSLNDLIKEAAIIVLEGLAGGTFLFVTFFEVLAQERANDHSNLVQLNAIVIGFLVIAGLQTYEHAWGSVELIHGH